MGTRNLTIVHKDGEYKVAQYGKWDGYPEGLGLFLLNFLKSVNIDSFRNAIDNVSFYTKEELKDINKYVEETRKNIPDYNWQKYFPHLSRDCGGDILNYIVFKGVNKVENNINFAADSLFCEWAYVIDLDTNKFEVYQGFNEEKLNENERFFYLEDKSEENYHPVKFIKEYDIDDLPNEQAFINDLASGDDEE